MFVKLIRKLGLYKKQYYYVSFLEFVENRVFTEDDISYRADVYREEIKYKDISLSVEEVIEWAEKYAEGRLFIIDLVTKEYKEKTKYENVYGTNPSEPYEILAGETHLTWEAE